MPSKPTGSGLPGGRQAFCYKAEREELPAEIVQLLPAASSGLSLGSGHPELQQPLCLIAAPALSPRHSTSTEQQTLHGHCPLHTLVQSPWTPTCWSAQTHQICGTCCSPALSPQEHLSVPSTGCFREGLTDTAADSSFSAWTRKAGTQEPTLPCLPLRSFLGPPPLFSSRDCGNRASIKNPGAAISKINSLLPGPSTPCAASPPADPPAPLTATHPGEQRTAWPDLHRAGALLLQKMVLKHPAAGSYMRNNPRQHHVMRTRPFPPHAPELHHRLYVSSRVTRAAFLAATPSAASRTPGDSGQLSVPVPQHAVDTLLRVVKHPAAAQARLLPLVPELLIELWEEEGNFSAG